MLRFVNAKINIGLYVTGRRPDGYHNLESIFYPVGLHSGTDADPYPFNDILEITTAPETQFIASGRSLSIPTEKNLVWKAVSLFSEAAAGRFAPVRIELEKHLPDGAGMGGGSADASFTLSMLNELCGAPFNETELSVMAARLGADCPFFIRNEAAFVSGIGEIMEPIDLDLSGHWAVIAKPAESISTREAFGGITPHPAPLDLRKITALPPSQWRGTVTNDFESVAMRLHPEFAAIKESLYRHGAEYASMSGSGSAFYGIFADFDRAASCHAAMKVPYMALLAL